MLKGTLYIDGGELSYHDNGNPVYQYCKVHCCLCWSGGLTWCGSEYFDLDRLDQGLDKQLGDTPLSSETPKCPEPEERGDMGR